MTREVANPEDPGSEIIATPIENHVLGTKSVQSGFFKLPESENISAVIFNDSGTISKFNRMGVCAGFGSDKVVLIREGYSVDPTPNAWKPIEFTHVIGPDYHETWIEGMDVYHNPKALNPLDPRLLPGATHHALDDAGQLISRSRGWKAFQSTTTVVNLGTN